MTEIVITLPPNASPDDVERVRAAFPDAVFSAPEAAGENLSLAAEVENALANAAAALPGLPEKIAQYWTALGGWEMMLWLAVALAIGYAAERLLRIGLAKWWSAPPDGEPRALFRERLPGAVAYVVRRLLGLVLFAVVAIFTARSLPLTGGEEVRVFARGILHAILVGRVIILIVRALVAPDAPGRRLMGFTDEEAVSIGSRGVALGYLAIVLGIGRTFIGGADQQDAVMPLLAILLIQALFTIWFYLSVRQPLHALCRRSVAGDAKVWLFLARNIAYFYILLALIDATVKGLGVLGLLGGETGSGRAATMLLFALTPLAIAGLRVWYSELSVEENRAGIAGGVALAEGAIVIVAAMVLMAAWGIDPFADRAGGGIAAVLPAIIQAGVIIVIGFAIYRAAAAILLQKAQKEGDSGDNENLGEMGGEGDRLATVLPILRGFILAAIGVTTILSGLSVLGLDIAPLLASAGVVGLAIGFGAQTLVSDIISGLFYLYEDAFRVGEFIDTDNGKGTVEKISLRSATLRHSRGAVNTVPFSKMGTIQNYSRDWAIMKFTFEVPADTDVEMVRKMVKKVGAEMAENPEFKDKILMPLKSQGAVGIQGRNYQIGCKFMTKPGEQFIVRRQSFAMLQKALREKGIELAAPDLSIAGALGGARSGA